MSKMEILGYISMIYFRASSDTAFWGAYRFHQTYRSCTSLASRGSSRSSRMEEKNLSESVTMSVREKTGEEHNAKRTWHYGHPHIPQKIYRSMQSSNTDLSRDVCNGSSGNTPHTMNSCISRSCSFRFLIDRARRCKYMLEGLIKDEIQSESITF